MCSVLPKWISQQTSATTRIPLVPRRSVAESSFNANRSQARGQRGCWQLPAPVKPLRRNARRLQANLGSVQQQLIVALAPRRKHGNQHCRKIAYDQMLSMSFDSPSMPTVHKAAAYSVTKSSVRSVLHFVAAVYMQVQMFIVGCLVLRANSEPLDWIMYRLAFDETTERATLNLAPGQQHRSTWHILVSSMWLVICWHGSVYRFSLVMPPVVTTSTKGDSHLAAALPSSVAQASVHRTPVSGQREQGRHHLGRNRVCFQQRTGRIIHGVSTNQPRTGPPLVVQPSPARACGGECCVQS